MGSPHHGPYGWRAGTVRVLANALLVLLAYGVVSMGAVAAEVIITGWTPPDTVDGMPLVVFAAVFFVVRWIYVLPGLLLVLVGIEYVARRSPRARVLTAIIAFAPMLLWELTKSPGDFPSITGAVLGVTAVLFAVLARLPGRFGERSTRDRGAAQPPAGTAVAPR